jgi:PAS domain S-box-containing protein
MPLFIIEILDLGCANNPKHITDSVMKELPPTEAKQLLEESEAKYNLLIESVKDYAIFMLDREGFIITWNSGAEKIKGYTKEEILHQKFSIFYTKEDRERNYPSQVLETVKREGRFEEEGWRVKKNGSKFWANVSISAVYNKKQEIIGFTKITRDLTEKKNLENKLLEANKELRKSEELSRLLISGVKDYAIFLLTKEGNIATWNDGAKRIKGYHAEEVIGSHFSRFYLPEAIEAQYPTFELSKALKDGRFEDEGWRVRKDGSKFWANVLITPIYNSENQLLGFTKITRDLTERIRNENLMMKNQELYRLNLDLDNFIYAASHDLKAPIANIEGLLNVLLQSLSPESRTNDRVRDVTDMMRTSIERFKNTISSLTDVIKLQKENSQEATTVNVSEMVQEVLLDMKHIAESESARIDTDVNCSIAVQFSKNNFRSIVYNLISNAIKYRSPDRLPIVRIACHETDENVVFKVQDNGLGMGLPDTSRIFKMFQRLHNHVDGTGVGLYMVKRIIENSGGRIEVQSKLGEGSTFIVYLNKQFEQ